MTPKWDPCVVLGADEFDHFLGSHLDKDVRKILFVAGAGFDPRAMEGAKRIATCKVCLVDAVFFSRSGLWTSPYCDPGLMRLRRG